MLGQWRFFASVRPTQRRAEDEQQTRLIYLPQFFHFAHHKTHLAAAQLHRGAAIVRVVAVRQVQDELVGARHLGGGADFLLCGGAAFRRGLAHGDVLTDGPREDHGFLRHVPDLRAPPAEVEGREGILVVDDDVARAGIVEAQEELRDGALARLLTCAA